MAIPSPSGSSFLVLSGSRVCSLYAARWQAASARSRASSCRWRKWTQGRDSCELNPYLVEYLFFFVLWSLAVSRRSASVSTMTLGRMPTAMATSSSVMASGGGRGVPAVRQVPAPARSTCKSGEAPLPHSLSMLTSGSGRATAKGGTPLRLGQTCRTPSCGTSRRRVSTSSSWRSVRGNTFDLVCFSVMSIVNCYDEFRYEFLEHLQVRRRTYRCAVVAAAAAGAFVGPVWRSRPSSPWAMSRGWLPKRLVRRRGEAVRTLSLADLRNESTRP